MKVLGRRWCVIPLLCVRSATVSRKTPLRKPHASLSVSHELLKNTSHCLIYVDHFTDTDQETMHALGDKLRHFADPVPGKVQVIGGRRCVIPLL